MFGLLRKRKIDRLSAKIGDAKKALKQTKPSSVEALNFRRYLKNDIANWQRQIDKLKGKNETKRT